jgi:hypothetical protein|nr:MAG TPA: hypothetical protein [Caudoviricetes sp.]
MNQKRIRLLVNMGPLFRVVDALTANQFIINHKQVINELLLTVSTREVNRHYNQIDTHIPMCKDDMSIQLTSETLYQKLINETYLNHDKAVTICNTYIDCMYQFLINIHELMSGEEIIKVFGHVPTLYYYLTVEEYLGDGQFILAELVPGQDQMEVDTSPWFYLNN